MRIRLLAAWAGYKEGAVFQVYDGTGPGDVDGARAAALIRDGLAVDVAEESHEDDEAIAEAGSDSPAVEPRRKRGVHRG